MPLPCSAVASWCERSGLTGELQLAGDDRVPALLVPERGGGGREPSPRSGAPVSSSRNALTALPQRRRRRSEPSATSCARPSSRRSDATRLVRRRRRGARRPARPRASVPAPASSPAARAVPQRLEIGLARKVDVERLELPSAACSSCAARAVPKLEADAIRPRNEHRRVRAEARRAAPPRPRPAPRAPRRTLPPRGSPAPRPARARRAAPGRRSARRSAAGTRPRRRSRRELERGQPTARARAATSSSGASAACARCQARRSGSTLGIVASASARCTSRRALGGRGAVDRRPEQWVAERDSCTDGDQIGRFGRSTPPRSEDRARQRLARGASDRRSARPHRGAAGVASPRVAGRPDGESSPPRGSRAATNPPPQSRRRGSPTRHREAARATRAGCRVPRR